MRTTVIPAQITTVEDKIAGNLSMTQLVILLVPIFFGTLVFAMLPPTMHIVLYKLPLVLFILLLCLILSLRVKEKIIALWLLILLAYNLRPQYYVFNKNDSYLRDTTEVGETPKKNSVKAHANKEVSVPAKTFGLKELKELETFIKNPNYSFSLKPDKKGGLFVIVSNPKHKLQ